MAFAFLLFFKSKQHVPKFDSAILVAEGFELKFPRSLKNLHAFSGYNGCSRQVVFRRGIRTPFSG